MTRAVAVIDVAHPPLPAEDVERVLGDALRAARAGGEHRVLKVVHGWGSGGRGGATRETVRNWLFRRRGAVRAVIDGERFASLEPVTRELLLEVDLSADPDLNRANPGISLVWVR